MSKSLTTVFFLLLSCVADGFGMGEFVHLDWSRIEISDKIPEYCNTIRVGKNYEAYSYSARVLYPEFVEVSKDEADMLGLLKTEFGSDVKVETHMGVSQKEGYLDIQILPVVRRNGKLLKLVSFKLQIDSLVNSGARSSSFAAKSTPLSSRYKAHSVLGSGKWVKIRVEKEGIYQLSKTFLAGMGFSDIKRVKVFGYGGRVQNHVINYGTYVNNDYDDLEEVPKSN